jgi:hypothetical protein
VFKKASIVAGKYPASERHSQERIISVHDAEPFCREFHEEQIGEAN